MNENLNLVEILKDCPKGQVVYHSLKKIDRWNLESCGYKRSDYNHNQFKKFENGFYFTVIRDTNAYGDPYKPQVVNWRMLVDYKSNELDYPCCISVMHIIPVIEFLQERNILKTE